MKHYKSANIAFLGRTYCLLRPLNGIGWQVYGSKILTPLFVDKHLLLDGKYSMPNSPKINLSLLHG